MARRSGRLSKAHLQRLTCRAPASARPVPQQVSGYRLPQGPGALDLGPGFRTASAEVAGPHERHPCGCVARREACAPAGTRRGPARSAPRAPARARGAGDPRPPAGSPAPRSTPRRLPRPSCAASGAGGAGRSRCKAASSTECGPGGNPVRFPFSQDIPRSIPTQFPCDEISGNQGPEEMKLGNQTASTSKVRRVDFGDCGPPATIKVRGSGRPQTGALRRSQSGSSRT